MIAIDHWYDVPRFFVAPDDIVHSAENSSAVLTGSEAHHAVRVLRLKSGDAVVLLDGLGNEFYGQIGAVENERDGARLHVEGLEHRKSPTEPPFPVHLVQGLPKGDKFEFVLQKGTEVGVTSFWPVLTERVAVSYTPKKAEAKHARWERIAAEAAKQSRRGIAPQVNRVAPIQEVVSRLHDEGSLVLLFWEESTTPLRRMITDWTAQGKTPNLDAGITVVVGPEGGLSPTEVAPLLEMGIVSVSLGPRILRTETAGMIAPALALFALMDN